MQAIFTGGNPANGSALALTLAVVLILAQMVATIAAILAPGFGGVIIQGAEHPY